MSDNKEDKLKLLLAPFPECEINHKPAPTKAQTDEVKRDFNKGARCNVCGGWHHPKVQHLSYVGHAATTKRLLSVDPLWDWDFLNKDDHGFPLLDGNGGLWITLTVLGVTRKGYGDAQGKTGANAVKETIGDAIRNAAMRFGVALELWHKGGFDNSDVEPETASFPIDSDKDKEKCITESGYEVGQILEAFNASCLAELPSVSQLTETFREWYANAQQQDQLTDK